jgi:hypothetical protein
MEAGIMLRAKAEIQFTLPDRTYHGSKHFRPVFRFGDGLLFSGTILSNVVEYSPNKKYTVDIDFFTIEDEAYNALKPVLKSGMGLTIQEGVRITGIAKLMEYSYAQ